MPGETITLQAGQCGNQVGLQYWNQLASEHGISPSGELLEWPQMDKGFEVDGNSFPQDRKDRPDLFFTMSDSKRYVPRAVLIDLEPSVISKATNALPMFNPRNIHVSQQGNGAANNWQHGYSYGLRKQEELIDLLDREVDKCDNVGNFQLIHSVAGGTGSGVGSLLLELLNDRYTSKKLINTFSIFPSNDKTSDVVVQPYNTMLTLKRLIDYSDATFVYENDALNRLDNTLNSKTNGSFESANKLIAYSMSTLSNPVRFPNYMYSSYDSILSTLVPSPDLKFISSALPPPNLNEYDTILELMNDKYKLNGVKSNVKYITMINYILGANASQSEIRKAALKVQSRADFVPWTSSSVHVAMGKPSVFVKDDFKGIQISNNTSIVSVLGKTVKQYDLLAKREAYINFYTESNDREERARVMKLFNECRESVVNVMDEYNNCQSESYLEDDILEGDEII